MPHIVLENNKKVKISEELYNSILKEVNPTSYADLAAMLFSNSDGVYYIDSRGVIDFSKSIKSFLNPVNSTTHAQLDKLLAINKIMNVAKYFNGDWHPNWDDPSESKFYIKIDNTNTIKVDVVYSIKTLNVVFKNNADAKSAIELLGEPVIRKALTDNY